MQDFFEVCLESESCRLSHSEVVCSSGQLCVCVWVLLRNKMIMFSCRLLSAVSRITERRMIHFQEKMICLMGSHDRCL